jgi:hypothetical protein
MVNGGEKTDRLMTLEGRCVSVGASTRSFLAHLLGLTKLGGQYRIRAAAWLDHAIEASIPLKQGEVVFRIERRKEEAAGLVESEHLVLYYRGEQEIPVDLAEAVERYASEHLAGQTLESLADKIAADPELGDPSQPMPPGVDDSDRPRSLLDTWGDRDAYADFFAGGETSRAQLDSLDPGTLFIFVQHGDCECLHVNPHTGGHVVWLVNYPWDNRIRHGIPIGERREDPIKSLTEGMITSDLDENDVIMGNPQKFGRLLKTAEMAHRRTGKTLFISNTCTPVVTGEDVESAVKRFKAASGCPLFFLTVSPRSMTNVFHDVLVTRRLAAERKNPTPRQRCVNLIGFRSDPEAEELLELLSLVDITVNCILIPDLDFKLIGRLPEAAVNVFLPNRLWQHLYDQLQFSTKIPFITPPAPFGLERTMRWIGEIDAFFGSPEDTTRKALKQQVEEIKKEHDYLKQKCGQFRLGFVVRSGETHFLTDPAATWGVPLIEMLEEIGFALDIFIKVEDRESARKASLQVYECFRHGKRHIIKAFDSLELMDRRIRDSAASAFFSSHFFDWRLTAAGKNLFSLQHFEMGLRGVLRTMERLLGICQTPFYRRYQRYLKRTPEGLRGDVQ